MSEDKFLDIIAKVVFSAFIGLIVLFLTVLVTLQPWVLVSIVGAFIFTWAAHRLSYL